MIELNEVSVTFGEFPNGETYLPLKDLDFEFESINRVRWRWSSSKDITELGLLMSHLKAFNYKAELYITYLPYSRMDVPNEHYAMSLNYIADTINCMGFTKVTIREPHSKASLDLIKNSIADEWVMERLENVANACGADTIFYPDFGAYKRYKDWNNEYPQAFGTKKRDYESGEIESYGIEGDLGEKVLIVDDLCSRGGTFIRASEMLKKRGVKNVYLLVAHCEDNVFTGRLFDFVDHMWTSNDMLTKDHDNITKIIS